MEHPSRRFNIKIRVPERETETTEKRKPKKLYQEHICRPQVPTTINDRSHAKGQHCEIFLQWGS